MGTLREKREQSKRIRNMRGKSFVLGLELTHVWSKKQAFSTKYKQLLNGASDGKPGWWILGGGGGVVWGKMMPDWAEVWSVGTSKNQSDRVTKGLVEAFKQTRTTKWPQGDYSRQPVNTDADDRSPAAWRQANVPPSNIVKGFLMGCFCEV